MALGARPADIIRDALVRGGRFAAVGIVIGVVLAGGLAQLLRTFLLDVSPSAHSPIFSSRSCS
jgi:ABC-type lipoprotein release transport system permease subunit